MAGISVWTIYFKPKDHPEGYCAREHRVTKSDNRPVGELIKDATIEQLRERFSSQGLVCVGRDPADDPVIVESWI